MTYVSTAVELCDAIPRRNVRVDVDDRDGTVGKKVRDAEEEWIPYLAVVGERERRSGCLAIRSREEGGREEMTLDALIETIRTRAEGMPFRPLPLPKLVSKRPIFCG